MSANETYDELGGVWGKDCHKYKIIGSSDAPEPTLVENRGQVAKKCYHKQKRRRCLRHGDESRRSDSYTDSGRIRP